MADAQPSLAEALAQLCLQSFLIKEEEDKASYDDQQRGKVLLTFQHKHVHLKPCLEKQFYNILQI